MRLRPYRSKSDYEYVAKWVDDQRIHALWCAGLLPYPVTQEALDAFLEQDAQEWGGCAYVATEEDGTPIGFFCYSVNVSDDSGFLKFIVLDPRIRGKGYGVQMLGLAVKYAFEITGAESVQLNVFRVNEAARKCYRKVGFTERAVTEDALVFQGESWARVNMVLAKPEMGGTGMEQVVRECDSADKRTELI